MRTRNTQLTREEKVIFWQYYGPHWNQMHPDNLYSELKYLRKHGRLETERIYRYDKKLGKHIKITRKG